ncbi:MAG TPA: DUF4339 domain-containing protein, partial [Rhodospirillales bacterium]|nr:DUF4339 domain-containing protein [Rhodospirillales bacterium]
MSGWHFTTGTGQIGPLATEDARRFARSHPEALCWRPGFSEWQPVAEVPELLQ